MPVLRSRKIPPFQNPSSSPSPKTLKNECIIQPLTPSKTTEPLGIQATPSPKSSDFNPRFSPVSDPPRRRSLRLASKSNFEGSSIDSSISGTKRRRNRAVVANIEENDSGDFDSSPVLLEESSARVSDCGVVDEQEIGYLSLRSGVKLPKKILGMSEFDSGKEKDEGVKNERDGDLENEIERNVDGMRVRYDELKSPKRRFTREEKGKGVKIDGDFELHSNVDLKFDGKDEVGTKNDAMRLNQKDDGLTSPKRFSREEKGKGVLVEDRVDLDNVDNMEFADELSSDIRGSTERMDVDDIDHTKRVKERFKNIARRNASKYAHFDAREDEERNGGNAEVGGDVAGEQEQPVENVEDWPGPFSTAMKIIRDREKNSNAQVRNSSSVKGGFPLISWIPRKEKIPEFSKRASPSLLSLCVDILVMNVDAISSLRCVPDAVRNMLCRKLCDSRKMNPHFLSLLLDGSPSEIRLADCSWLEESVFEKSFEACETKTLTVLQLDLGGHCVSDSSFRKALVTKGLDALTTISLKGACRVSDVGLAALISSAPKLRSINLSQCSLLTDVGIESIANSLGSILQELYLDYCDTLDAMRILPKLKQLKSLEVLSLRGVASVSDKFIRELIDGNGLNLKELVLANCLNLTDSSLMVIAENCSRLCVLDLSFLGKLTDIGMAYLANGCRGIQDLKLDRCPFSDDAIAAFLETSGESLKELSLNNIKKVGQNTTLSLARRCRNLESLDLSWCRCLSDECLGLIADSCLSLRLLKIFGCTQVTSVFVEGHSNPHLKIIGLKLTPILEYIKRPEFQQGPLHYSSVLTY